MDERTALSYDLEVWDRQKAEARKFAEICQERNSSYVCAVAENPYQDMEDVVLEEIDGVLSGTVLSVDGPVLTKISNYEERDGNPVSGVVHFDCLLSSPAGPVSLYGKVKVDNLRVACWLGATDSNGVNYDFNKWDGISKFTSNYLEE